MRLEDVSRWSRGDALEIVLVAVGAVLLARFVRCVVRQVDRRVERKVGAAGDDELTVSETHKHERALTEVVSWTFVVFIYFVAVILILQRLNVPITSLVAPATLIGAGIGFGSQRLVQDLISGFFILAERQYGYGDVVRIAQPGEVAGVAGTVEGVTLRTTKLRTESGELIVIPNGEIRQVTNLSKDWARALIDIPVAIETDIPEATEILRRIGDEMWAEKQWSRLLLDPPSVMGIERFGVGFLQMRFVARTLPGKQWEVARELRSRITAAFQEAGIPAPPAMAESGKSAPQ